MLKKKYKFENVHSIYVYYSGNTEMVQLLIGKGKANVNLGDIRGVTPLHFAVKKSIL